MTLPTGTISINNVNTELTYSATRNTNLNETEVRQLAGVGGSGTAISMSNLQGKSNLRWGDTGTPYHTDINNYIGTYGEGQPFFYFTGRYAASPSIVGIDADSNTVINTPWIAAVSTYASYRVRCYVYSGYINSSTDGGIITAGNWSSYYNFTDGANPTYFGPGYADSTNSYIQFEISSLDNSQIMTVNANLGAAYLGG